MAAARLQPAEMPEQGDVVTILHFNDCYNVEEQHGEPVGGASRFCTALKGFSAHNPLILFSGDVLAPSFSKWSRQTMDLEVLGTWTSRECIYEAAVLACAGTL